MAAPIQPDRSPKTREHRSKIAASMRRHQALVRRALAAFEEKV
jgi:hypothetical protein